MKQIKNTLNKRGVMGLDTVKEVLIILLFLGVIAIALFVGLNSLVNSSSSLTTKTIGPYSFINNSVHLNATGQGSPITLANFTSSSITLSNVRAYNRTGGELVNAGNYTISGKFFTEVAGTSYNNTVVNVSATYHYTADGDGVLVVNNITNGTVEFFKQIPTVMIILGVVVIILAVTLILYAVSRFGNRNEVGQ